MAKPPEHILSHEGESARRAVIDEIHRAFADVTRENGISWNECVVIDNWGSDEECESARRTDRDKSWTELVDDPNWQPFPGIGGFSFIDGTGFRYYLPPTMIRFARGDVSEWYEGHLLGVMQGFIPNGPRVWTPAQLRATARFVDFMAKFDPTGYRDRAEEQPWQDAAKGWWAQYLNIEVPEDRRARHKKPAAKENR